MTLNEEILLLANGHHTPFLDVLMSSYTSAWIWIPFYVACFGALVYKYGWLKAVYYLAFIGMAIGAADYICASIIRPIFQQMRPSNPDNPFSQYITVVNGYRGGRYGMPSCHAANCFALAASLITFTRSRWLAIIMPLWALFVCYTRMYMGVHYPSDLLVGACIGTALGILFAMLGQLLLKRIAYIRQRRGYNIYTLRIFSAEMPYNISIPVTPIIIPTAILIITLLAAISYAW